MRFVDISDVELEMIEEGYVQIAGRSGNKIVRKFRCTTGARRGRIVSKPSTCSAPKNVRSSINIKKAKRRTGSLMKVQAARTKRARKTTQRLKKLNVHSRSKLKPRKQTARRR
jgi:translation elongation factor EF-Tu-like GTPase